MVYIFVSFISKDSDRGEGFKLKVQSAGTYIHPREFNC